MTNRTSKQITKLWTVLIMTVFTYNSLLRLRMTLINLLPSDPNALTVILLLNPRTVFSGCNNYKVPVLAHEEYKTSIGIRMQCFEAWYLSVEHAVPLVYAIRNAHVIPASMVRLVSLNNPQKIHQEVSFFRGPPWSYALRGLEEQTCYDSHLFLEHS